MATPATPTTPYDAVLQAARDVTKLDRALDAEMLASALLGSVYSVAEGDRAETVRDFVGGFLTATARRRTAAATTIRALFARLVPQAPGAAAVKRGAQAPSWLDHVGRVRLTGCHAYGDVYGDQTSYLVTFGYDDNALGGPEHAVVVLVDHNIGIVKDVFVGGPADAIVAQVRHMCDGDELTWYREEDPRLVRGEVARYLRITDGLANLPEGGSLATDRALAGARLALLPAPPPAAMPEPLSPDERADLTRRFLESSHAARFGLTHVSEAEVPSLHFCLSIVLDYAASFADPDPLRWSPAVAGLFLLDWVHRRAVLDLDDAAMLPRVVRAWAAYTNRERALPAAAAAATQAAIEEMIPEFVRLYTTGERRSPATAAVAQLIAEGVDPNDPDALEAWLAEHRP